MSGKDETCADEKPKNKKKRNATSLLQKVKMLSMLDKGLSTAAVGRQHGV
jgi:hypothetical protein